MPLPALAAPILWLTGGGLAVYGLKTADDGIQSLTKLAIVVGAGYVLIRYFGDRA